MTQIPATVTIVQLPAGTTPTGSELIEAVQTSGGVANSVSLTLSQVVGGLGGVPTSNVTGTILQSLGTGFSATWVTPASFITIGTGLAIAGSTSLVLSLATASGPSVLGVGGTATAAPLPIAGTGAQVLRVNDAGTGLGFGAVNLGSSAAVTGVLPNVNYSAVNLGSTGAGGVQGVLPNASYSAVNLGSTGAGGVQGVLPGANFSAVNLATSGAGGVQGFLLGTSIATGAITSTLLATGAVYLASAVVTGVLPGANMSAVNVATTGAGGIQGQPFFLPTTALPAAGASTMGIKISSASLLGFFVGSGSPTFTAGTGSLYLNGGATTSTTRLYININGVASWATFTASL